MLYIDSVKRGERKMPEYNIRLTVRTSIEKYVEAASLEEAEELLWKDLIDMDPQQGHYILINGSKTYEFLNKDEVNGDEDGKESNTRQDKKE